MRIIGWATFQDDIPKRKALCIHQLLEPSPQGFYPSFPHPSPASSLIPSHSHLSTPHDKQKIGQLQADSIWVPHGYGMAHILHRI